MIRNDITVRRVWLAWEPWIFCKSWQRHLALSFDRISLGPLAAAAIIVTLPVLVLTVFAPRRSSRGGPAGAVKGG